MFAAVQALFRTARLGSSCPSEAAPSALQPLQALSLEQLRQVSGGAVAEIPSPYRGWSTGAAAEAQASPYRGW